LGTSCRIEADDFFEKKEERVECNLGYRSEERVENFKGKTKLSAGFTDHTGCGSLGWKEAWLFDQ